MDNHRDDDVVVFIDIADRWAIAGWVCDKSDPEFSNPVTVMIDGEFVETVQADLYREDVRNAGHRRTNVGFQIAVPARFRDGAEHCVTLCGEDGRQLTLISPKTGAELKSWTLPGKPAVKRKTDSIVIHIDRVSEDGISGWGYNEAKPLESAMFSIYIDDSRIGDVCCEGFREDVRKSGHPNARVGFKLPIPGQYFDDKLHRLNFLGPSGERVLIAGEEVQENRREFQFPPVTFAGQVDGLHEGALRGWALAHDRRTGTRIGGLQVLVTLQGRSVAQLVADQFRADVGEECGGDPNCGFVFVPQSGAFAGKSVELRFHVIPGQVELRNSPFLAAFPDNDTHRQLRELAASVDDVFIQLWHLRSQLKSLLPGEQFSLGNYHEWAQAYYRSLADVALPPLPTDEPPLVSIICPTYRPRIADFTAAVQSIISQTYQAWELLIVDDASDSAELTACIRGFAAQDKRIRPVIVKKNCGISGASNRALRAARGRYVAFFDHDDLMVDRAIEFMVHAALNTGAKLLYCDEDKIDDSGRLSEPNLKPDWNYRLLLAQNYICHILFVDRERLNKTGPLRSKYDGAQDHDLILRLAEITQPDEIYHVPEILYHWRKTPFSTAAAGGAKTYAVTAGMQAVSDHLARKGLRGQVTSPLGVTIYEISWELERQPTVTIIVPYREHVAMTRACIDALRGVTNYKNYEILLVDNWSSSDEALEFAAAAAREDRIRLIRIQEPFNFSRLNNAAVAQTSGEFVLFLNNDVIVHEPRWLTQMIGEALADLRVAVVGNKLLYPNGLVQHGGVILGVGGVADHAHRGLKRDAPGYLGRAICAQDLSAVTAACMLARRGVFNEVGGFDEDHLRVAYNDVDFCLKVVAAGHRVVWTPDSVAEHRESLSRGSDFRPENQLRFFQENQVMNDRWKEKIANDPFYGRYFSRRSGAFHDLTDPTDHRKAVLASTRQLNPAPKQPLIIGQRQHNGDGSPFATLPPNTRSVQPLPHEMVEGTLHGSDTRDRHHNL